VYEVAGIKMEFIYYKKAKLERKDMFLYKNIQMKYTKTVTMKLIVASDE